MNSHDTMNSLDFLVMTVIHQPDCVRNIICRALTVIKGSRGDLCHLNDNNIPEE